ncbi:MAG: hypothetical protein P8Y02_02845 [Deinococcales bacterium]
MPRRRTASRSPRRAKRAQPFSCPREAWRQLLAAVDRAFDTCERFWQMMDVISAYAVRNGWLTQGIEMIDP